jgi:hypothetical protein
MELDTTFLQELFRMKQRQISSAGASGQQQAPSPSQPSPALHHPPLSAISHATPSDPGQELPGLRGDPLQVDLELASGGKWQGGEGSEDRDSFAGGSSHTGEDQQGLS